MKILCLDFGTRCGWATWCQASNALEHGTWDMSAWGDETAARLDLFSRRLSMAIRKGGITHVHAEEPFVGDGRYADLVLLGQQCFALVICRRLAEAGELQAPLRLHHPSAIKKATVGWVQRKAQPEERARAAKNGMLFAKAADVLAAIRRRHPALDVRDENSAIALGIADLVRAELRGTGAPSATDLNRQLFDRAAGRVAVKEPAPARLRPSGRLRNG